jgi:peptidyl-prolyl cis-trans isomerase A (cyclophilin A)
MKTSHRTVLATGSSMALALVALLTAACGGGDLTGSGGSSSATGTGGAGTSGTGTTATTGTGGGGATGTGGAAACGPDVQAPIEDNLGTTDPELGNFSLDQALAELPNGPGPLRAIFDTDLGTITCVLEAEKAPNAVANFVGLARGRRAWKDPVAKHWVRRRFYDGLTFHRVPPDFVAQGGDPLGTGFGGPGYKFDDELVGLHHAPGTLAYANSGANTNGSQFYITATAQPLLDAKFTIFGFCKEVDVVTNITHVPTTGDPNYTPLSPLHMKTVTITRCAP